MLAWRAFAASGSRFAMRHDRYRLRITRDFSRFYRRERAHDVFDVTRIGHLALRASSALSIMRISRASGWPTLDAVKSPLTGRMARFDRRSDDAIALPHGIHRAVDSRVDRSSQAAAERPRRHDAHRAPLPPRLPRLREGSAYWLRCPPLFTDVVGDGRTMHDNSRIDVRRFNNASLKMSLARQHMP